MAECLNSTVFCLSKYKIACYALMASVLIAALAAAILVALFVEPTAPIDENRLLVTRQVYMDVTHDGEPLGRLVFGLFGEVAPRTVENFARLCVGEEGVGGYGGSVFHRVIEGFMAQGGDFERGDGRGGRSVYEGRTFADESFALQHYGAGWLSMANAGPDSNGSQFFVLFGRAPWLDGAHVVFGKLLDGFDALRRVEHVPVDADYRPLSNVTVARCGVVGARRQVFVDRPAASDSKGNNTTA